MDVLSYNETIALKLQDELVDIINNKKKVNEYKLIVYKYVFISELGIPLLEDFDFEIDDNSFIIHVNPDNLEFKILRKLDDVFDKFSITIMNNHYNILKLRFNLK